MSQKHKKNKSHLKSIPQEKPTTPPWIFIASLLAGGWAFWVYLRFYQVQPFPFSIILDLLLLNAGPVCPPLSCLMDYGAGLLAAVFLLWAATSLGRLILGRVVFNSHLEAAVISTALGYVLLANITLGLGACHLFRPVVFYVLLGGIGLLGVWRVLTSQGKNFFVGLGDDLKQTFFANAWCSFFSLILLFMILTNMVMAFVPELFYDAQVYHLGVPNFYLQEGGLKAIPVMPSKFPFTLQMINLIGLALKDEMVSKMTHVFMMMLGTAGLAALGLRFKKPLWGLVGALLFYSIPTAQYNVWTSGIDLGVTLFGFLAVYAFVMSFEENSPPFIWVLLSAFFSGAAVASKYTAATIPFSLFFCFLVIFFLEKKSIPFIVSRLAIFSGVVVLLMVPWLIKNFMESGNPVYPFLSKLFGGIPMPDWRYSLLKGENNGLMAHSLMEGIQVFWKLSIQERSSLSFQGPLYLACLPLMLIFIKKPIPPYAKRLMLFALFFIPVGFYVTRLTRYLLPGFISLGVVLALALHEMFVSRHALLKAIASALLLVGVLFQLSWGYLLIGSSYKPQDVLMGRMSRTDYISFYHEGMNPYPPTAMFNYIEKNLPPNVNVLFLGEEKGYRLKRRHLYSGVYDVGLLSTFCETSKTPEEVVQKMKAEGVTHIMLNVMEAHRLGGYGIFTMSEDAFGVFCAFWEKYVQFIHAERLSEKRDGGQNSLVLCAFVPDGLTASMSPIENIPGLVYEKNDLPRMGVETVEKKIIFYQKMSQKWPQVYFFRERLQSLLQEMMKAHQQPPHQN